MAGRDDEHRARGRAEAIRRRRRRRYGHARCRLGIAHRAPRPLGMRQVDAAAPDRGLRCARRGDDRDRRARCYGPPAARAQRRIRVPELRALPAPHRRAERRVRARSAARSRGAHPFTRARAARSRRLARVRVASSARTFRRSAPTRRARARRSCWTSRSRRSTSTCAASYVRGCASCTRASR